MGKPRLRNLKGQLRTRVTRQQEEVARLEKSVAARDKAVEELRLALRSLLAMLGMAEGEQKDLGLEEGASTPSVEPTP